MRTVFWVIGGAALIVTLLLRNPLFLVWRPLATPMVFAMSLVVLCVLLVGRLRAKPGRQTALLVLWSGVLLIAGLQEGVFHWRKYQVLNSVDADAQRIGEHLIIGYSDPNAMKTLVGKGLVGGIFISAHNVAGRSPADIGAEISAMQSLRQAAGLPPLIVTTDQEGGIVSRMSPPLGRLPSLADVTAGARLQDIELLAFAYGERQGRELAGLGVNVNFAPLADLSSPAHRQRLDFRSLINRRAIDADPARVSPAIIGYAHGL